MVLCHCELLKILPQSPDLNPIENIFHIVTKKLAKDALERGITRESYEQFCERAQRMIRGISQQLIDRTIQSMSVCVASIIRNRGERLKY